MLAWLVVGADLVDKFRYWGAIAQMVLVAFGVHALTHILYRGELQDMAEHLVGVVPDAVPTETA